MLNKDFLRKKYLGLRKKIPSEMAAQKSKKISEKLLAINGLRDKNLFLIYLPINNEVETKDIIKVLILRGQKILVPYYLTDDHGYHLCRFKDFSDLEEGPYKILQPKNHRLVEREQVDVAIIPGLAFDKRGVRLGYGKGVYDRLLGKSNALKIGLAYDFQVLEKLPQEKHDLVVAILITESRIFRFT